MSLKIEIHLPDLDGAGHSGVSRAALEQHMDALGFARTGAPVVEASASRFAISAQSETAEAAPAVETNTSRAGESEEQNTARRERGKPAPGRARRTKEEIAEDEAADKRDAEAGETQTTQSISTGENRVGPEDDPETEAQDRADEEAEERDEQAEVLTVMNGKDAIGEYAKKFGIDAAAADGAKIFADTLGAPPVGRQNWTWTAISELTDGMQAKLNQAVKAWRAAAAADARYGGAK